MDYLIAVSIILGVAVVLGTILELGNRWIDRMILFTSDPKKPIVKKLPE